MESAEFVKVFHERGLVGFYLRVLQAGMLAAGDPIQPLESGTPSMSVADVYRVRHLQPTDLEGARRAANLPALSMEWRDDLLSRLA